MIGPTKYVRMESSLLGLGASILTFLSRAKSQSDLWNEFKTGMPSENFGRFVAAMDLLFAAGCIRFGSSALIEKSK